MADDDTVDDTAALSWKDLDVKDVNLFFYMKKSMKYV